MSIEAMKMALEALDSKHDMTKAEWRVLQYRAFTALRDAIAGASGQGEQQEMDCYGDGNVYRGQRSADSQTQTIYVREPVAWGLDISFQDKIGVGSVAFKKHEDFGFVIPLYLHPPRQEWVGLTARDFAELPPSAFEGALWAEGKLKEKNK